MNHKKHLCLSFQDKVSLHSLGYSRTLSKPGWPKLIEILGFYLLSAGIKAEGHYYSGTERHLFLSF